MDSIKDLLKTALSFKAIFQSRRHSTLLIIVFYLILNIGFTFPFVLGLLKMDQLDAGNFVAEGTIEALTQDPQFLVLKQSEIKNGVFLPANDDLTVIEAGDLIIAIDPEDSIESDRETGFTARITDKYMYMNVAIPLYFDFQSFEDTRFDNMETLDILNYFLKNGLSASISQWLLPILMVFYLIFLLINTFFVAIVIALACLFRLGDKVKLSIKETINVVILSTVMPTVLAAVVSIVFNLLGLNLIIYNFGTFAVFMIVRKLYLNPKTSRR